MNLDQSALEDFSGMARLFPLPNLVFFPHALQPLHIFEPRYRQMMADALDDDRLLSLVLLKPGWEKNYDANPAIYPIACLGRIAAEQLLPDGRYNLLLRGIARIRILEEVASDRLYRTARVEVIHDTTRLSIEERMELRKHLAMQLLPRFADAAVARQVAELFQSELPLGAICDILTFALPLPIECKQRLLEEDCEEERAAILMASVATLSRAEEEAEVPTRRRFPPEFSPN